MVWGEHRSIEEVFQGHVVPFIGDRFLLMLDNVKSHIATVVLQYHVDVDSNRIEWPSRSPYLNHIEYVWDMLASQV